MFTQEECGSKMGLHTCLSGLSGFLMHIVHMAKFAKYVFSKKKSIQDFSVSSRPPPLNSSHAIKPKKENQE